MPAGTTATLNKADFDRMLGSRLLQVETLLGELAQIKEWTDGKTDQGLVDFFGGAYTIEDAQNIKGALEHAETTKAAWDQPNKVFVDRLTAPGVR